MKIRNELFFGIISMHKALAAALLFCGLMFPLLGFGEVMGFFSKKITVYPFSAFSGQLLHHGEPAGLAKITRSWNWDGTKHEETVIADEDGAFSFASIEVETRESLAQFVSEQEILVEYNDTSYLIWTCGKLSTAEFGEFGGPPKNLTCEITEKIHGRKLPMGFTGTNCTWEL